MNPTQIPRFKLFSARRDRTAAMPFIMLPALIGSFTGTQRVNLI